MENIKQLFLDLILLNKELEKKGGRAAVERNEDAELLYDKIFDLEVHILKSFGLPTLMKFRNIILEITSENEIEKIVAQLKNEAENYLTSSAEANIDLLEDAKIYDLKTYDVLPEIGIEDSLLAMFYLEEYFKKDKISAKELIHILKSFDDETTLKLGQLHYDSVRNQNLSEADEIFNELLENKIPYLKEFRDYRPVYPY